MKSLKSLIASLLLVTATSVSAEECPALTAPVKQSMGYFSLGLGPFPAPIPNFAFGYRTQVNHHGFDAALQAATVVEYTQVKLSPLYQYFFKPNLASQFYVGGGVGASMLFHSRYHTRHIIALSPEVVLGKQYQNETHDKRFFQAQISFPTVSLNHAFNSGKVFRSEVLYLPLVVFSYGMGF